MNNQEQTSPFAYAPFFGLVVGIIWSMLFFVNMYSMSHLENPSLWTTIIFYVLLFYSLRFMTKNVHLVTQNAPSFSMWNKWKLSILICINASLITTLVQYLYLQFFDKGRFIGNLKQVFEHPMYTEMFANQNIDISAVSEILSTVTVSSLTSAFLSFNIFLSLITSLFVTLMQHIYRGKDIQ